MRLLHFSPLLIGEPRAAADVTTDFVPQSGATRHGSIGSSISVPF